MFSLKTDKTHLPVKAEVSFGCLSSYDLNVDIDYLMSLDKKDIITIRYEGVDGKSLFEVTLNDGLMTSLSLICFEGSPEIYDSIWTRPQNINEELFSYRLFMDDQNCVIEVAPHEINQRQDFFFLIYTDAVLFLTGTGDIYSSHKISDELYILLAKNGLVLGYVILSEKEALRFKEVYGGS
ncbi:MAG: hypothetical protein VSS75_029885 [Candidatus Parabeggiatoa sp.]|nr:hypothetical protein [Candidatus Parabeggiatoa sp.]